MGISYRGLTDSVCGLEGNVFRRNTVSEPYVVFGLVEGKAINVHLAGRDGENNRGAAALADGDGNGWTFREMDVVTGGLP